MNKRELFPLFFSCLHRVPTRGELFWARHHLVQMKIALAVAHNPYHYMTMQPEATKLRYIVSDLNKEGESLWPIRLTTNVRISCARAVLKTLSSRLNTILKDYP